MYIVINYAKNKVYTNFSKKELIKKLFSIYIVKEKTFSESKVTGFLKSLRTTESIEILHCKKGVFKEADLSKFEAKLCEKLHKRTLEIEDFLEVENSAVIKTYDNDIPKFKHLDFTLSQVNTISVSSKSLDEAINLLILKGYSPSELGDGTWLRISYPNFGFFNYNKSFKEVSINEYIKSIKKSLI